MRESEVKVVKFYEALEKVLAKRGQNLKDVCRIDDLLEKRILEDYGAVFIARETVVTPPLCVFENARSVEHFQKSVEIVREKIGETEIELQAAAMRALQTACAKALEENLEITPRGGAEAAARSFDDTLRLWNSRFLPALDHWTGCGEITFEQAEYLKNLSLKKQIKAVLELEQRCIFFSKDFSKSILYSVAAPGASQHLSLLAFDANEFYDERVRKILGNHGWFRTVNDDLPHFTFLGRDERELPECGLKKLETKHGEFWIPNV